VGRRPARRSRRRTAGALIESGESPCPYDVPIRAPATVHLPEYAVVRCIARSHSSPMRIRVIDAFTDRPFAGNPAAVCLLDSSAWPDEAWMRRVAAEMSLETAFAHPLPETSNAGWALRWFTPAGEANLCGHATLATGHAPYSDHATPGTVHFASPGGIGDALGAEPEATYRTGALGDLLAVVGDEATVRALSPDFAALTRLTRREVIRGVIASARAAHRDSGYDFISRYFAPANGIPEDPVTGSAHTALAPYWSHRLGRDRLIGLQASTRTGMVHTAVHGDRVHLTGHAVTSSTASCTTPPDSQWSAVRLLAGVSSAVVRARLDSQRGAGLGWRPSSPR
jgi:predicted PhzF superfamily epimerase YddE/YHI9